MSFERKPNHGPPLYQVVVLAEYSTFATPIQDQWLEAWKDKNSHHFAPNKAWHSRMRSDMLNVFLPQKTTGKKPISCVLRNLMTKEYICCEPRIESSSVEGFVVHPETDRLRIDDVLLMRIGWGRKAGYFGFPIPINKGRWAGHCFDITPFEEVSRQATGRVDSWNAWVDSTDEIVREAFELMSFIKSTLPTVERNEVEAGYPTRRRKGGSMAFPRSSAPMM
ncbi:hypothetical protein EJ08DRAFT_696230 [Tothia fuscella]|uniref:Uncharacterized protein n=1 Tax=Tothia fuscella TaxID=1048955 RepID=A0A9P4TZK5_9PEZI|nr:hypothetical protein EJ08DRAFT_696230 [Tothia fuscella]